jgi:hypothetical protein
MRRFIRFRSFSSLYLWLSSFFQRPRSIFRFSLVFLLVVFGFGLAGSLEGGFNGLAGGQTNVAYQIAIQRNNGSLKPLSAPPRFRLSTTSDAETQKYFELDEQNGDLLLRDGLQTISVLMNPLQVFPVRIDQLDNKEKAIPKRSVGLYVRVVNCPEFRRWKENSSTVNFNPNEEDSHSVENLLECEQSSPVMGSVVVRQQTERLSIKQWLDKVKIPGFIHSDAVIKGKPAPNKDEDMLRDLYKKQLNEVFGEHPFAEPPPSNSTFWVLVLQQDARPGQKILDMQEIKSLVARKVPQAVDGGAPPHGQGSDSQARIVMDPWLIDALLLRLPFLLALGFVIPVLVYLVCLQHRSIRAALQPYLLLLLSQIVTMFIALQLMGEGLVLWVGLIFTWLRLIQLLGLLNVGAPALWIKERPLSRLANRWLISLLSVELVLWGVNGIGLLWHVFSVFRHWNYIAPA